MKLLTPASAGFVLGKAGGGGGSAPAWVLTSGGTAATLDIDFLNDRAWNGTASSVVALLSCTRNSSKNYTKADGTLQVFGANVLATGTSGLLAEASGTNAISVGGSLTLTLSQCFALWTLNGGAVTEQATASPDGSTTASLWTASASGAFGSYISSFNTGVSGNISASVYVKKGNQRYFFLDVYGGANDYVAVFDLDTISYVGSGGQTATTRQTITALANGWFRITVSIDSAAVSTNKMAVGLCSGNNVTSVSGDTLYLWGAQIEVSTVPTSYIPDKNLLLHTEELGDAYWSIENITISSDAAVSPDGTTTADKLAEIAGLGNHEFYRTIPGTEPAIDYTLSCYAKMVERRYVAMHISYTSNTTSWATIVADLQTGTITQTGQGAGTIAYTSSSITSVGNGWYRYTVTARSTGGAGTGPNQIGISVTNSATPTVGDFGSTRYDSEAVGSGAYFWGAQFERGSVASPYIRAGANNNTRAADVITFNDLTWLNGASDSIYSEWKASNINNAKIWAFDATNDKLLDEQTGMSSRIAGATVATTAAAGATVKAAARMALNDFAISMNGGTVATDTSETAPGTLTASRLGCDLAGANQINNYIRRVAAFKGTLLNNAALQTIST